MVLAAVLLRVERRTLKDQCEFAKFMKCGIIDNFIPQECIHGLGKGRKKKNSESMSRYAQFKHLKDFR